METDLCFIYFYGYFLFRELAFALFDSMSRRLGYASRSKVTGHFCSVYCAQFLFATFHSVANVPTESEIILIIIVKENDLF